MAIFTFHTFSLSTRNVNRYQWISHLAPPLNRGISTQQPLGGISTQQPLGGISTQQPPFYFRDTVDIALSTTNEPGNQHLATPRGNQHIATPFHISKIWWIMHIAPPMNRGISTQQPLYVQHTSAYSECSTHKSYIATLYHLSRFNNIFRIWPNIYFNSK